MDCNTHFSLHNMSTSSLENEVFFTSTCISNRIKLALFTSNLAVACLVLLWLLKLLIGEYLVSGWKLNLKNKVYVLSLITVVCEIVTDVFMLTGVTSVVRYIIYASFLPFFYSIAYILLRAWFRTVVKISHCYKVTTIKKFNIAMYVMQATTVFLTITLGMIGPMVEYQKGNYLGVNWFYIIFLTSNYLYCAVLGIVFIIVGRKLSLICLADNAGDGVKPSEEILALGQRVNVLTFFAKMVTMMSFSVCPLPVWLIVTSSMKATPLGLNYITYFYYFNNFIIFFGVTSLSWTITNQSSMFTTTTTTDKNSRLSNSRNSYHTPVTPGSPIDMTAHPTSHIHPLSPSSSHSSSSPPSPPKVHFVSREQMDNHDLSQGNFGDNDDIK